MKLKSKFFKILAITIAFCLTAVATTTFAGGGGKVHVQDLSFLEGGSGIIIAVLANNEDKKIPTEVKIAFSKDETNKLKTLAPKDAMKFATVIITRAMKKQGYIVIDLEKALAPKIKMLMQEKK